MARTHLLNQALGSHPWLPVRRVRVPFKALALLPAHPGKLVNLVI